ncbi:endochitinase precursor [Thozetella sp. PMI_491]|nr:endochitinase precursor [Thozetella sp. PMI_491]
MVSLVLKAIAALACLSPLMASASPVGQPDVVPRATGYQNAVYYPNYDFYPDRRNYRITSLPVSKLSYVVYAFAKVAQNGEVSEGDSYADYRYRYPGDKDQSGDIAYGNVKQLYLLKKANRNLKTILSIGGGAASANFSDAVSTEQRRGEFAKTAVTLLKDWGFDGIDIDWEFPQTTTDASNFVLLLQAIRTALDNYAAQWAPGYHFLLSIAASAQPGLYKKLDLKSVAAPVDFVNLMAYDFTGSWTDTAGHQANLYPNPSNTGATPSDADSAVKAYINAGVPASKIVLGMPLYGRSFQSTSGLGKSFSGVGPGDFSEGSWDYKRLPKSGATEYVDSVAVGAYSYDSSTKELVSYDTPATVRQKVDYIKSNGLAGAFYWEASGDIAGDRNLISTSYTALGALVTGQNQLAYNNSMYDNIALGMP